MMQPILLTALLLLNAGVVLGKQSDDTAFKHSQVAYEQAKTTLEGFMTLKDYEKMKAKLKSMNTTKEQYDAVYTDLKQLFSVMHEAELEARRESVHKAKAVQHSDKKAFTNYTNAAHIHHNLLRRVGEFIKKIEQDQGDLLVQ